MSIYNKLSDTDLITLLKESNESAFEILHDRLRPSVYHYALRICKDEEAADEIAQNVMLKVWQQRHQIDITLNFKAWLSKIAANQSFDFFKSLARENALKEKVWKKMQESPAYTEDQYVLKEYLVLVEEAVNLLPLQQQKIYRMSREMELTYDEIAAALNISPNTVRNHMASAISRIRHHVQQNTSIVLLPAVASSMLYAAL